MVSIVDNLVDNLPALVARAGRLAVPGTRRILGLTGPPGVGKSTLAAELTAALAPHAVLVPMDGFHLAQAELSRLGRADREGAPDTFDANGYRALLARLREPTGEDVYAPQFRRDLEEPIAGAIRVPADVPLVVTEGNYLLVQNGDWAGVAELLDEIWYLEIPAPLRLARLVARHHAYGRPLPAARSCAYGSDERNAEVVAATRNRADLLVRLPAVD
jgi:pantothenate kinase